MYTARATPDEALELRSLESEITDIRRYILSHPSSSNSEELWMQLIWSDLLLERWSAIGRSNGKCVSAGRGSRYVDAGLGRSVRVLPNAVEPITLAGLGACLQAAPGLVVVPNSGKLRPRVDVCVHATDQVDADFMQLLQVSARRFDAPAVLVTNRIERTDLDVLASCRVAAVLPRVAASSGRLGDTVRAVGAARCVPGPDLLAGLRQHA
ncbi:hypothetical protein SAMN04489729_7064 [Amycolatopsis lurida]|uniref:Uncharacterized protein n=1 Tax=Amycolatopsis lurida NRRL 2430 TaxID=1460371 RepID=A0A2P2FFC3_AMYLU|nr:hypothetical protein [Amycolatopsis lurida]KFU75427.1 hypothetical protein BB31_41585 [Amycolatopsis lurida NRRL 2430]SEE31678.1 hypothetical protein SAMN04489729_7064 [Amycolatopsis lurida]